MTLLLIIAEFASWYESIRAFSYQLGALAAILPISLYNGKRGGSGKTAIAFSRWAFYVYYPLHMIVLLGVWMLRR